MYGGPGCGKTFMMDMFYEQLPIRRKRRVHFHDFMIDVHKRLHAIKMKGESGKIAHPIESICDDLISDAYVLCFDEFQVRLER